MPIASRAATSSNDVQARTGTGIKLTCLCLLFFFHSAAMSMVGRAYYALIGLNDVNAPVGVNVFLEPAIILSIVLIAWRLGHAELDPVCKRKYGLGVALAVSFIAATVSVLANYETSQVALVYFSAFGSGLLVYVALS